MRRGAEKSTLRTGGDCHELDGRFLGGGWGLTAVAILERHFGLNDRQLAQVFPGLPPGRSNIGEMLAA